jgi:hypothetical protein
VVQKHAYVRNDPVYVYAVLSNSLLKIDRFLPKVDSGENLRGDHNSDGQITTTDAVITLQIAVGSRPCNTTMLAAADMSRDGRVTSLDAPMIMQTAAGAIEL